MKKNALALSVVCLLLSTFGSALTAATAPASAPGDPPSIAAAAAPLPTWLASQQLGNCRLTCSNGTHILTTTTLSTCCAYPGTLCPAGSPPIFGLWQPFVGSAVECPFGGD